MKHSHFLISTMLLLFLLVAKSSAKPKTVNKEVINRVCHRKRTIGHMCQKILTNYKGQPISQARARVSAMAHDQAKSNGKQMWDLYNGVKEKKSELKLRFHNSWKKYTTAANLLTEASGFLQNGDKASAQNRALLALIDGMSGDKELDGHKQYLARGFDSDSMMFQELCAILIALCDEL